MGLKILNGPLRLGGPGGLQIGGFNPRSIPGLAAWFDASKITGLADGAAVAQWDDSSGNARHATQATAGFRPLYKTAILNGKPGVLYDATDDSMAMAAIAAVAQPNTIFVVGSMGTTARYYVDGIVATNRHAIGDALVNAGKTEAYAASATPPGIVQAIPSGNNVWSAVFNGAASQIWRNGTGSGTADAGGHTLTGITLGSRYGGGSPLNGYLFEVLWYSAALSTADRRAVERYLGSKYALAVA